MEVQAQPAPIQKKKPGRKRTKLSKIAVLLKNLPPGFSFVGPPELCTEEFVLGQLKNDQQLSSQDEISASHRLELTTDSNAKAFTIGSFRIQIDDVRVTDLKAMRKVLPRTEYKLLKNRKCARISRSRRKEQTSALITMNKRLKVENDALRR